MKNVFLVTALISAITASASTSAAAETLTVSCNAVVYDSSGEPLWSYNDDGSKNVEVEITQQYTSQKIEVNGPNGFKFRVGIGSMAGFVRLDNTTGIFHSKAKAATKVIVGEQPGELDLNLSVDATSAHLSCSSL